MSKAHDDSGLPGLLAQAAAGFTLALGVLWVFVSGVTGSRRDVHAREVAALKQKTSPAQDMLAEFEADRLKRMEALKENAASARKNNVKDFSEDERLKLEGNIKVILLYLKNPQSIEANPAIKDLLAENVKDINTALKGRGIKPDVEINGNRLQTGSSFINSLIRQSTREIARLESEGLPLSNGLSR